MHSVGLYIFRSCCHSGPRTSKQHVHTIRLVLNGTWAQRKLACSWKLSWSRGPKFNCLYKKESACNGKPDDSCYSVINTFYLFQNWASLHKHSTLWQLCSLQQCTLAMKLNRTWFIEWDSENAMHIWLHYIYVVGLLLLYIYIYIHEF